LSYYDLAREVIEYQAQLRDLRIETIGQRVDAWIPHRENVTDFYGDYDPTSIERKSLYVIPQYQEYYAQLNVLGWQAEDTVPLHLIVKVSDFIPRNTILDLQVTDQDGISVTRKYRILGSMIKHVQSYYARMAFCVPVRNPGGQT